MFDQLKAQGFEILALHHAEAILKHDMPDAVGLLETILSQIQIPAKELILGGGGEGKGTQRLRNALSEAGWKKHRFEIRKIVDGVEKESISHEIDHVKRFPSGVLALEIEWNNKDPFFDRDLENFKRLHADGVIRWARLLPGENLCTTACAIWLSNSREQKALMTLRNSRTFTARRRVSESCMKPALCRKDLSKRDGRMHL